MSKTTKTNSINIQISDQEMALLQRAVDTSQLNNLADFIPAVAYRESKRILHDSHITYLTTEDFERIAKLVSNPPHPNQALQQVLCQEQEQITDLLIGQLDITQYSYEKFDCGIDYTNSYLKNEAYQQQRQQHSSTYVIALDNDQPDKDIVAYYTLTGSSIVTNDLQSSIPTIKIERFAIDVNYEGRGICKLLVKNAFDRIAEVAYLSGAKAIEIAARDQRTINFYQRLGFVQPHKKQDCSFLPIETIIYTHHD